MSVVILPTRRRAHDVIASMRGFNLIELMVALALGLLISLGLVTLFDVTSKTNKVQEGMAEMQENGRYAITRINYDLRLASRQLMNASGYSAPLFPNTSMPLAPNVYVDKIHFPDGDVAPPTNWPAMTATKSSWPLSPSYFISGSACSASACAPTAGVPSYIQGMGTSANSRVQNADVVTVRYLNSPGWSSYQGDATGLEVTSNCTGTKLVSVSWKKVTNTKGGGSYTSPALNFKADDLAMLTDAAGNEEIFQVDFTGSATSATLTPKAVNSGGSVLCLSQGEVKLFNFSRDFVTVTYWLRLDADPTVAGRLIPALMRTQRDNTNPNPAPPDVELVQGVEQMNFLYGVQQQDGKMQFLSADVVATNSVSANCPPPPGQFVNTVTGSPPAETYDNGCLWRALTSIEVHLLVDNINNMFTLTAPEMQYRYSFPTPASNAVIAPPAPTANMANGIKAGTMMRREFLSLVSVRNYNT
jgi:type IV pilus assembly protein PilW